MSCHVTTHTHTQRTHNAQRGELATSFIVAYALTCAVAGYASGSYYRQFFPTPRAEAASQWQKTMLLTVRVSCVFVCVCVCVCLCVCVCVFCVWHRCTRIIYWLADLIYVRMQVLLFPSVVVAVVFVLNLIAEYYDTTHALHLSTIFKMFAIWLFVSFPLTVAGTLFGRHWAGKADFPWCVERTSVAHTDYTHLHTHAHTHLHT